MNNKSFENKLDNIEDPSFLIEEFEWIPLFDTTLVRNLDIICPNYAQLIEELPTTATATLATNTVVQNTKVMLEVKTTFPQQKLFGLKEVIKPLNEFQSLALNLQFEIKQYSRLSLLELGDVREMSEDDYFSLVKVSLIEFYNRLWESQSQAGKEGFKQFLKQKPKLPMDQLNDESKPSTKRPSRPLSATLFANKLIHKLSVGVGRTNSNANSNQSKSKSQCSTPKSLSPPLSRDTSIKKLNASRFLKSAVSLSAGNTPVSGLAVQLSFESNEYSLPPFTLKVTVDITLEKLLKAVRNKCILDGYPIPDPKFKFAQNDQLETKINSENLSDFLTSFGDHHLLIIANDDDDDDDNTLQGSPDATLLTPGTKVKLTRSNTQVVSKRPQPRQRGEKVSRVLNGLDLGVFVNEPPIIPPRRKFTKSPHSDFKSKVNTITPKLSLTIPPSKAPCVSSIPQLDSERSSLEDSSSEKDSPITPTSSPQNNPIILNFKQKLGPEASSPKAAKRASKFLRSLTMKFDKSKSQSLPTSPTLIRSQTSISKGSPQKETLVFKNLLEGGQFQLPGNASDIGLQSNGVQHLNISVTINQDLKYHFELDPYQPTYTSVMNRVIYHFSQNAGVPLRILNDMSLVYLSEEGNIELTNTSELQKLIVECKGQDNMDLLLVPKGLMEDKKRVGIQWELPPNLYDLGVEMEGNYSVAIL